MTNVEYQIVLHALDAARTKLGLDLIAEGGAEERIRLLVNTTVKAGESAGFGTAVAAAILTRRLPRPEAGADDDARH